MKRLLCSLWIFSLILPVFSQITVDSGEDAIAIALQNSKNQIFQELKVKENMIKARLSVKDFLPRLGFSYSESDTVKKGMADSRSKTLQFSLSQLVFDGGAAWNQYKVNNLQSQYEFQSYLQSLEEFKSQILDGYNSIVMQQEVVKIKKDVKESGFLRQEIMAKELELGLVREIDYLDYIVTCRKLEQEENLAKAELEKQKEIFRQTLGLPFGTEIIVEKENRGNEVGAKPFLSSYLDPLVELSLNYSPSLKQQRLEYDNLVQQNRMNKRWFLPNLTLEGSVSLSGIDFPLREPDFSLRLKISFEKNNLVSLSNTTSMGFNQEKMESLGNSVSGSLNPDIGYFSQNRLISISLLQKQFSLGTSEEEIRNSMRGLLLNYDTTKENCDFSKDSVEIQEKKVSILFQKLENGEATEMDYLQSLMELAAMKIEIVELQNNLNSLLRTIELMAGLKSGGIYEVIGK